MSRTITMWMAALALIGLTSGCMDNKKSLLNNVNAVYTNVKLIVNDPVVREMISDDAWEGLKEAETAYLSAVLILNETELDSEDGKTALATIVSCADILLTIVDGLNVCGQYEPVITAARLSVGLLKNNLPE